MKITNYKLQITNAGKKYFPAKEASNEKFLRGGMRKANNAIDALRKAPCAMLLPPGWSPEAKIKEV